MIRIDNIRIYPWDIGECGGAAAWNDNVIARMFRKVLEEHPGVSAVTAAGECLSVTPAPAHKQDAQGGLKLRDVLLLGSTENVYMVHETADVGFISMGRGIQEAVGQDEYENLLNAEVAGIRPGAYGTEIVLSGIDPQALTDFDRAASRHSRTSAMLEQGIV